jgi:hypothetical protein
VSDGILIAPMESVYLETSFVSLLVAKPSRDLLTSAKQQSSREWWERRRALFVCHASSETIREASFGDAVEVLKRLDALKGLPVLRMTSEAEKIMLGLLRTGALPAKAQADAAHLAIASAGHADYLLTWNCRHLANAQILRRLELEAARLGWALPKVCTPLELMGDSFA